MSPAIQLLNEKIEAQHLLKHPFYRAWTDGKLSIEDLRHYSRQYFAHVRAFPVYLSEMHSRCEDLQDRRVIASNLADEEARTPTHPDLWLQFAAGLGASAESVSSAAICPQVSALIDQYRSFAKLPTGLAAAALYCYERQIPDVAGAKIDGLVRNYAITDASTLEYFQVHQLADVEHADQWSGIISREVKSTEEAAAVADQALGALWTALDGILEGCGPKARC